MSRIACRPVLKIVRISASGILFGALCIIIRTDATGVCQEPKPLSGDEIKALQAKFQVEREQVIKDGSAKRFQPILIEKADLFAKKAEAALAGGRLAQAAEAFRQARWQLPYTGAQMPEHVARVLGSLRLRHGSEIHALAYAPDGTRIATASRDGTVKVWDLGNGHELLTYTGHNEWVRAVAFGPDGKTIASGGREKDIKLWDAATGKDILTLKGQGIYTTGLAFSKDGKYLVSCQAGTAGQSPGFVVIYNVANGSVKHSVSDFRNMVESVNFNHDGSILGVAVGDGTMKLYEFARMINGQPEYWSQQDPDGAAYFVAFSPDNRSMVRLGAAGIKIYNMILPGGPFQVASPRRQVQANPPGLAYRTAVFSKDNRTLYTGSSDGLIKLWDADTLEQTGTFKAHNDEVKALALSPAGNQLASASSDYTARLWDFDIVLQSRDFSGHEGPVWSSSFSPDGQRLVSASADQTVRVWDVATGKPLQVLKGHTAPATFAVFSPDGKYVLSAAGDKTIKLWDAETGAPVRTYLGHIGTVTCLAFSANGKQFVSGGADKTVRIWSIDSEKPLMTISDNHSLVAAIAFHPEGKQIAIGNVDQRVRLYDLQGKRLASWIAHGTAVGGVAFSPNGQFLASCGADHLVRIWPLDKPGQNPITLAGHTGPLSSVAWRNDNQHVASAGADQTVKLWKIDKTSGKEAQTFRGHRDWVTSVAFSKDGFYIVSSGVDRIIKIWELTSREAPLLAEHTGSVDAVAFSPDGKWIASGATDRTIKIWDPLTGEVKETFTGHAKGILGLAFTPDSKLLISTSLDRSIKLWDVAGGQALSLNPDQQHAFNAQPVDINYLMVAPNGKIVLLWLPHNHGSTLTGYDLFSGKEMFAINDQRSSIKCAAFSGDGKRGATGALDGSVRVFDLEEKGKLVSGDWFVYEKGVGVGDLALSPDGATVVVGSDKGDIKICTVATKEAIKSVPKAHAARILAVQITPDGKRVATQDAKNVIKVWDMRTGEELRQWNFGNTAVASFAFSPDSRQMIVGNRNTTLYLLDMP